ncbi:ATP-dependent RNA helicase A protein isoform X3 [Hydra vulgaris]|uniref:RNA helicase n=1 Tax=Hydra vulgaris TaxID=6087 RepID=A0ABM4BEE8_HYDVU
MAGLAKGFLFHWVGKQMKLIPHFYAVPDGPHRFNYQAKIDGINYIAFGGGPSKKEGEAAAARDLLNYLVSNEIIPVDAVPPNMLQATTSVVEVKKSSEGNSLKNKSVSQVSQEKSEGAPVKKLKLEETNVDADAHLHGNWTLLNAKTKLHQFLNENKIPADFVYYSEGPDHQRLFRAELSFWLKEADRKIIGKEAAHSKKLAAQYCSRSLVRQLYHMGIIPAAEPGQIGLKKKPQPAIPIWKVALSPEVEKQMQQILHISKIEPVQEPNFGEKISLQVPMSYCISDNNDEIQTVNWEPPSLNWNPWLAQSIIIEGEEGERVAQSGSLIYDEFQAKWDDSNFVSMLEQRKELPVYKYKQQIIELVNENQVVIIRGATGCGKTTQVPQYILDDFILKSAGDQCNIVVTQPRRISATSVAERVATERSEFLGNSIGYSVRFDSILPRSHGSILFCTTGVLLRRMENGLTGISHIFVDEVHERDINSDFLLIILREMVSVFPNLRIVLMSATIDTNIFSQYFNNCPVLEIDGFLHPVQEYFLEDIIQLIGYNPPIPEKKKKKVSDIEEEVNLNTICDAEYSIQTKNVMAQISETEISNGLIVALLLHITSLENPGAILIFLPGWNAIFKLLGHLQQHQVFGSQKYLLIPLHSQIPRADQAKVFKPAPHGVQKIILSTNIAETSITIDDVVFVIDACKAKVKQFTSHNNMNNYSTLWASQSNLDQRKGRAGRVQPGFCFHLISKARYQKLAKYMIPEILRTPLHILVLSIKLLKLGKVVDILNKAMEPPAMDAVFDSLELLKEMKALEENETLTPLGYILSKLPIEPKLGKMMVLGCILNVGDAVCTLAASMCFLGPFEKLAESKNVEWVHKKFAGSKNSDHLAMLWAYQQWEDAKAGGVPAEERFCRSNELNLQVLRMTSEAKQQLKELLCALGFPEESMLPHKYNYRGADDQLDLVTAVLCVGLYPNICMHQEKRKVITTEGKYALIHKSSVVCSNEKTFYPSPFFIFGEKNRTQVVCCKHLTMIYPVQYLLFTPCKTEACHQAINIDEWLEIKMSFQQAALLIAFRNVVENLITQVSYDPKTIYTLSSQDNEIIKLLGVLSRSETGSYMIQSQSYGKKKENYAIGNFDAKNSIFQDQSTTSNSNPPLRFQQNKRQQGYQEPRQNDWKQSNRGRGFGRVDGGFRREEGGFGGSNRGFGGGDRGFGGGNRGFVGGSRGFGGGNRGFGGGDRGFRGRKRSFGSEVKGFEGGDRSFGVGDRGFGIGDRGFGGGDRGFGGGDRSFGGGDRSFGGGDRGFGEEDRGFGGGDRGFGGVEESFGIGERGFGSVEKSFQRNGEGGFGRAERGFGRGEGGFWRGYSGW